MIKGDIVNDVANKTGVPKRKAEQVVDALFDTMKDALAKGKKIELRGFGVFVVRPSRKGLGRNPRTGQEVAIPAGRAIRFKPGKELLAAAQLHHRQDDCQILIPIDEPFDPKQEQAEEMKIRKSIREYKSKFETINKKMNLEQQKIENLRKLSVERQKRLNISLQRIEGLLR